MQHIWLFIDKNSHKISKAILQPTEPDSCSWPDFYIAKIKLEMSSFVNSRQDLEEKSGNDFSKAKPKESKEPSLYHSFSRGMHCKNKINKLFRKHAL